MQRTYHSELPGDAVHQAPATEALVGTPGARTVAAAPLARRAAGTTAGGAACTTSGGACLLAFFAPVAPLEPAPFLDLLGMTFILQRF